MLRFFAIEGRSVLRIAMIEVRHVFLTLEYNTGRIYKSPGTIQVTTAHPAKHPDDIIIA
jgi:hypothetical protein